MVATSPRALILLLLGCAVLPSLAIPAGPIKPAASSPTGLNPLAKNSVPLPLPLPTPAVAPRAPAPDPMPITIPIPYATPNGFKLPIPKYRNSQLDTTVTKKSTHTVHAAGKALSNSGGGGRHGGYDRATNINPIRRPPHHPRNARRHGPSLSSHPSTRPLQPPPPGSVLEPLLDARVDKTDGMAHGHGNDDDNRDNCDDRDTTDHGTSWFHTWPGNTDGSGYYGGFDDTEPEWEHLTNDMPHSLQGLEDEGGLWFPDDQLGPTKIAQEVGTSSTGRFRATKTHAVKTTGTGVDILKKIWKQLRPKVTAPPLSQRAAG